MNMIDGRETIIELFRKGGTYSWNDLVKIVGDANVVDKVICELNGSHVIENVTPHGVYAHWKIAA